MPASMGQMLQPHFSFFCRIITYVWPSIPHPKQALLQICNPDTVGPLLLSFKTTLFACLTPLMVSTLRLLRFSPFQGLLLNVKPDVFSVLKVSSPEEIDREPGEESEPLDAADVDQSSLPCSSSQSSDCSGSTVSVSTEDLELSALLSRSSSDEEGSLRSVEAPGTPPPERDSEGTGTGSGVSKQEEAYVTMSSFYQINKSVQKQ